MKTTVKEITPQWAAQVLETKNPNNRKISDAVVAKYANDMKTGRWALTHQGIAFDLNGDLLDGQHRLAAIVKAGIPINVPVTVGIERSTRVNGHTLSIFGTIDGVRPRTPATMLQISGYKDYYKVAAMARGLVELCAESTGRFRSITATTTEEVLRITKGSIPDIASAASPKSIVRLSAAMLAPVAFLHTTQPEKAIEFVLECQTVSGPKGGATRALASWKNNHVVSGGSAQIDSSWIASSALFHWSSGKSVDRLYGGKDGVQWLLGTNPTLARALRSLVVIK